MLKKLLLLTLVSAPVFADFVMVNPEAIQNKTQDRINLCIENRRLYVANHDRETISEVNLAFSDTLARKLRTQEDVEGFLKAEGKIIVKQCSNGDYILNTSIPLKGGGIITATGFWLGYQVGILTAVFTGTIVVNAALPGIGSLATGAVVTGTFTSWTAAITALQIGAGKAFAVGFALPTP